MKSKKIKRILIFSILMLLFFTVWFSVNGISKTIDRTVSVDVYEGNDWACLTSSIEISGNFKKLYFPQVLSGLLRWNIMNHPAEMG